MAATATFHTFRGRNENILLGLWKIFESVEVTNGAPALTLVVVIDGRTIIEGLTVLSLFYENVSIVSASQSSGGHELRTWLHLA